SDVYKRQFLSFNTDGGNIGSADSVDNSAGHLDLAQSELGAFPSSPIITAGSTVTRTADSLVRAGTGFSSRWNADEMTIRVPVFDSPGIGIRTIWQAEDPSDPAGNRYVIYTDGTDLKFKIVEGGVATCEIIIGTITPRADHSVVVAWAVDDVAGSIDGNPEVTSGDTAGSLPSVGQRRIGASSTADEELYGHVPYDNWYIRRMPNVAALAS
ncbi:MAG: hypothetical protein KUG65_06115, partial [Sphingomonadaceae bacterium]|nr:hypothetical protein [Sphingomonadaceae bacterium]